MVLGFIMIGWIGGGAVAALHLGLDGSVLGALGLFSLSGAATILLTAALVTLPGPRLLKQPIPPSAPTVPRRGHLSQGARTRKDSC